MGWSEEQVDSVISIQVVDVTSLVFEKFEQFRAGFVSIIPCAASLCLLGTSKVHANC
jgi:hypothetical protein